ncbi:MAG: DUF2283 domain-containing protein [Oscillatoriales cyanobacterium SM2_1_8]|nr:DUF2283 domain-containing protein [Oscillatoriales cyanobacterium SM2_1_8]
MKIQYFEDTDTLYLAFSGKVPFETVDWDENTLLDLDEDGQLCGITLEHARDRVEFPSIMYGQIAA